MSFARISSILVLNVLGIGLFLSWYLPENHGFWLTLDSNIFFYFNRLLVDSPAFLHLVAITNNRAFDGCALIAMGLLYLSFYLKASPIERRHLLIIGFIMLLTAVVLNQAGHLLPVQHASPTLYFSDVNRVSDLTGIPTKDASSDSFPGDHGMMLMIFAAFMLRYFTRTAFAIGVAITVIFSLPRIMIGAHWFTDIAVGSLSVVLVGLSWWLLTPASDAAIALLNRRLPKKSTV
ncbi:putative membrane-bound phosphatase [Pectobacterium atrosepticum SCRI1043]|uniref:Lipid A 1-diphosphate synthase n=1 Tax=Pectobacterium atrosepticum (strain SCRI 1043 / ATCC BAA-672) TaxID=218491 RepID=Q6D3L0_PECAS|nr:phosphatase PAP2 family protein [Pectobacterium atrosepticum]GKV84978.1 membrane protein [Pectobacterium carotovorum subsp. carotovorum]AIA71552.1 membrane protein [Pectobacterium atrosepticum]AIK13645.1 putative membrane-bound phosphatase [Pectobacterium atrosepticum]ATY90529.1 phosphatase PAP2 family protein [Pectobacterium atrosepticum]KFX16251.1 membrane protein [Pectobacterium atrosepticum]